MKEKRFGPYVITASGTRFWLQDPQARDVQLGDIAHHLAQINRFVGALDQPYSVAQHSIMVSRMCPPGLELVGLMHDAPEAYMGDLSRPLKACVRTPALIEVNIWRAIAERYNLPAHIPEAVHHVDQRMMITEALALHRRGEELWRCLAKEPPYRVKIEPMGWMDARAAFIARFFELTGEEYLQDAATHG